MSTRLSDYDYPLPEHLIALYPPATRGARAFQPCSRRDLRKIVPALQGPPPLRLPGRR